MPRPTIVGTQIRRIDMHHSSAGKNKDYRITISEESPGKYRVYTEHGPAGKLNQGQEKTKNVVSYSAAETLAEKLRDDKRNQADVYRVVSDQMLAQPTRPTPPAPPPRARVSADTLSPASRAALTTIF
jgi:hypothetical protein